MRQTWKGLTVGAVVGAGIGLVLDGLGEGAVAAESAAGKIGRIAQRRGPAAKERLREASQRTMSAVREKDLPGRVQAAAEKAGDSDAGRKVHEVMDAVSNRLS